MARLKVVLEIFLNNFDDFGKREVITFMDIDVMDVMISESGFITIVSDKKKKNYEVGFRDYAYYRLHNVKDFEPGLE